MSVSLWLSWRAGVSASTRDADTLVVQGFGVRVALGPIAQPIREGLLRLSPPGEDQNRLAKLIKGDGDGALALWFYYLEHLTQRGFLQHAVHAEDGRLATLVAVSPYFVSRPTRVVADRGYALSRFAYLRREGAEAIVESPLAYSRIILNDCRVAALSVPWRPRRRWRSLPSGSALCRLRKLPECSHCF